MKTRKMLFFMISFLTISPSVLVKADTVKSAGEQSVTVSEYRKYLIGYTKQDALKAGVDAKFLDAAVSGAVTQLQQFDQLSYDKQQEYVRLLTVPNESFTKKLPSISARSNYGYSSATVNRDTQFTYSLAPGKHWPATTVVRVRVHYKTKGKKVLQTTSCDNYIVKRYNPVISLIKDGEKRYVTQNQGYTWARWKYTLGVAQYGAQLGHINASVAGDYKGYRSYFHGWRA